MYNKIRSITRADISDLKMVVDSSGLFPAEYLDGMMDDYFLKSLSGNGIPYFWCVYNNVEAHLA